MRKLILLINKGVILERYRVLLFIPLLFFFFFLLFLFLNYAFPLKGLPSFSRQVLYSDSTLAHVVLSEDDKWRLELSADKIPIPLKNVLLFREDRWFYYHPGINLFAVGRALFQNIKSGERVSGASTITMQVARMMQPKSRTYKSKFIEMFRALQLEWRYSKDEILALYLSMAPYGGNVEGIRAASLLYYGCEPSSLSLARVVTLMVVPNNPNRLSLKRGGEELIKARNYWLKMLYHADKINQRQYLSAISEPLNLNRVPLPSNAPHLSRWLLKVYPQRQSILTELKSSVQHNLEKILSQSMPILQSMGIGTCAGVIMENKTGSIIAYAGSANFKDRYNQGEVDGLRALRSPGSTLKPFLYGLAFEEGRLTPMSVVADVPVTYSSYIPENYDKSYRGTTTIRDALILSLNIPAVRELSETGVDRFATFLQQGTFPSLSRQKRGLGLSMILGGCGVTGLELLSGYSSFAREGRSLEPRFLKDAPLKENRLFSAPAAWMVASILSQAVRPDLPIQYENSRNLPPVSWKTGTSYGRRDAWAVGFNRDYTILVWAGNFDGRGSWAIAGAEVASPILFSLFQSVSSKTPRQWLKVPEGIDFRQVCSESGMVPGDSCSHLILDSYIVGKSSWKRCDHLKPVWVNSKCSVSYCNECMPESCAFLRYLPNPNPDVTEWYREHKVKFTSVPPHNPACQHEGNGDKPIIVFPTQGAIYYLVKADSVQLNLEAQTRRNVRHLWWFINGRLAAKTNAGKKAFVKVPEGKVKAVCRDELGNQSSVTFTVQYY
ncbi:MAG: penicillin-binding protein 1C [Sphingobacteriia bacterium]|nr:penicillin-binding protein 1C [Sphingobacteriia bacterium]